MTEPAEARVPAEVLDAFGFGGARVRKFERGVMNRHWLVSHSARQVVLGEYNRMRTPAAIAWEQALVEHAERAGWPVPAPIPAKDGSNLVEHAGRLWAAARYLEGEADEDSPPSFRRRGSLLARLHASLEGFDPRGQRPDTGKTWDLDAFVAPAKTGTFEDILTAFAADHASLAGLIRTERKRNLQELSALSYASLPDRPIHGDFGRWNLLWQDGELTGLLDFDQCRLDAQVCDIAPLLIPFMPLAVAEVRALLEGYESVRPLSQWERALLLPLARAALLRWVAFLLLGWRLGGALPEGVARTMTVRLPALDAAAQSWGHLLA